MSIAVAVCAPAFDAPGTAATADDGAPGFPAAGGASRPATNPVDVLAFADAETAGTAAGGFDGILATVFDFALAFSFGFSAGLDCAFWIGAC